MDKSQKIGGNVIIYKSRAIFIESFHVVCIIDIEKCEFAPRIDNYILGGTIFDQRGEYQRYNDTIPDIIQKHDNLRRVISNTYSGLIFNNNQLYYQNYDYGIVMLIGNCQLVPTHDYIGIYKFDDLTVTVKMVKNETVKLYINNVETNLNEYSMDKVINSYIEEYIERLFKSKTCAYHHKYKDIIPLMLRRMPDCDIDKFIEYAQKIENIFNASQKD